ncbi:MAG: DUF2400 domain-containing protein [Treponema sp.]|nr:DUF2400 domain-containing protein [Treponema sp.]
MDFETAEKLRMLSNKYETASFCDQDPSQFLRRYSDPKEAEAASFFAALLSFGSRSIFIPKIKYVFDLADKGREKSLISDGGCYGGNTFVSDPSGASGFYKWILTGAFEKDFYSPDGNNSQKFYRFYSYQDILTFFEELQAIFQNYRSLGQAVKQKMEEMSEGAKSQSPCSEAGKSNSRSPYSEAGKFAPALLCTDAIISFFEKSKIVPKGKSSAKKRLFMFLRWMVRPSSPVDLGLWDWLSPSSLIIPLDTHVLSESQKLSLIPEKSACSIKTALLLSDKLSEVWPDDPLKGDFALFGLGVDSGKVDSSKVDSGKVDSSEVSSSDVGSME